MTGPGGRCDVRLIDHVRGGAGKGVGLLGPKSTTSVLPRYSRYSTNTFTAAAMGNRSLCPWINASM